MSAVNDTTFIHAGNTGMPGQEYVHLWISIAFCLTYAISIVGNSVILFMIKTDPSLHEPMYIFLSMLALTDLAISVATMPTTLGVFVFKSREINLDSCLAQLFFIRLLQCIESSVLLLMALDRVIAIRNPLRYASILTPPRIAKMGLVSVLRGVTIVFPLPFLLQQFQYCQVNPLTHSSCLHQEIMRLACSDIMVNSVYGLFTKLLTIGLDSLLIFLSYLMILKTVLSIASRVENLRALNTCFSHLCAVLLFYVPEIGLSVINRFANGSSPLFQIFLGYLSLLAPSLLNPIVYSMKSKHIRERISRMFIK